MKVILLFALLGLSFYQVCSQSTYPTNGDSYPAGGKGSEEGTSGNGGGQGNSGGQGTSGGGSTDSGSSGGHGTGGGSTGGTTCDGKPAENPNDEDCVKKALPAVGKFLKLLGVFVCNYGKSKTEDDATYMEKAKQLISALNCTGCRLDNIFGTKVTLREALANAGKDLDKVGKIIVNILGALGIDKPIAKLLCTAAGKLLLSDCLHDALAKRVPALLKEVNTFSCEDRKDAKKVAKRIETMGIKAACVLDDALGTENVLQQIVADLGEEVKELGESLLNALQGVFTLACPLVELIVDGTNGGLLSGGGGGGGGLLGGLGGLLGGVRVL